MESFVPTLLMFYPLLTMYSFQDSNSTRFDQQLRNFSSSQLKSCRIHHWEWRFFYRWALFKSICLYVAIYSNLVNLCARDIDKISLLAIIYGREIPMKIWLIVKKSKQWTLEINHNCLEKILKIGEK